MRTFDEMLNPSTGVGFCLMALILLLLPLITSSFFVNSKLAMIELKDDGDLREADEDLTKFGGDGRLAQDQNIHEKEGDAGAGDHNHNDYAGLVHHNEHHNVQNGVMQDMLDMQMAIALWIIHSWSHQSLCICLSLSQRSPI